MADEFLHFVNVDRNNQIFNWVKTLEFNLDDGLRLTQKRSDEYNAIIFLTINYLMATMGPNAISAMSHDDIYRSTCNYIPTIFSYYCQINILKRGITFEQNLWTKLEEKIKKSDLGSVFKRWSKQFITGSDDKFLLNDPIRNYSFGENTSVKFIDDFVKSILKATESVIVNKYVEDIKSFEIGSNVCGCVLVKRIANKEHSQIWQAKRGQQNVVMKMEHINIDEKEILKMTKGSFDKILEFIKTNDIEYLNFLKLKDFQYRMEFMYIDYFNPLRMKVKIMPFLDGPISKSNIQDKKNPLAIYYSQPLCLKNK